MYDDLLLKYITVAGISWRQSNCDSRDLRKLCETDFSRGGDRKCYRIHEKSLAGLLTRSCEINLRSSLVNLMSLNSAFNSSNIWAIWCLCRNFSFFYFFHARKSSLGNFFSRLKGSLPKAVKTHLSSSSRDFCLLQLITRRSEAHATRDCPRKCQTAMKIRFVWTAGGTAAVPRSTRELAEINTDRQISTRLSERLFRWERERRAIRRRFFTRGKFSRLQRSKESGLLINKESKSYVCVSCSVRDLIRQN